VTMIRREKVGRSVGRSVLTNVKSIKKKKKKKKPQSVGGCGYLAT
jgi:hypothetical protein